MIPKRIWRFWTGTPEPKWMKQCGDTWKQAGWSVTTLTKPPWKLRNQTLYDQAETIAPGHVGQFRADIFRLELLHRRGGVWVDTDFQLLTTIDDLMDGGPWLAWEIQDKWLNQAIIASPPDDPWLDHLIDVLPESVAQGGRPNRMTGPQFVTRQFQHARGWKAMPQSWFYPPS